MADIFGSLIVWGGLHVAARPADDNHPYGYGKAEALAAVVSLMLLGAAVGIGLAAVPGTASSTTLPESGRRRAAVRGTALARITGSEDGARRQRATIVQLWHRLCAIVCLPPD